MMDTCGLDEHVLNAGFLESLMSAAGTGHRSILGTAGDPQQLEPLVFRESAPGIRNNAGSSHLSDNCDRIISKTHTLIVFATCETALQTAHCNEGQPGLLPDLTTLGKYLGGGFSCGAFGGRG
jgi:hypothetical protein